MSWDFLQRYDESWIWRRADRHHVTESARNFAALDECVADAARHGYVASGGSRKSNASRRQAHTGERPEVRASERAAES